MQDIPGGSEALEKLSVYTCSARSALSSRINHDLICDEVVKKSPSTLDAVAYDRLCCLLAMEKASLLGERAVRASCSADSRGDITVYTTVQTVTPYRKRTALGFCVQQKPVGKA